MAMLNNQRVTSYFSRAPSGFPRVFVVNWDGSSKAPDKFPDTWDLGMGKKQPKDGL